MTNKLIVAAIAIVFVGTLLMAVIGGGRVLESVFSTYILKVERCEYKSVPRVAEVEFVEPKEDCFVDYNRAKGDLAGGLAMFLVSAPIAVGAFWRGKRYM